jgi:nicotinate-nucleotide adenylyltransferase
MTRGHGRPEGRAPAPPTGTVGVFGGTFDPIHLGHLRAAEEVAEGLGLARVLFVPSATPPHKRASGQPTAPARDRYAWVERAIASNERFAVDPIELQREGPSYTVETLGALAARFRPEKPVFVIGDEAFADLGTWREPKALLALAHFAVMTRPPVLRRRLAEWIPEELEDDFDLSDDGVTGVHRDAGTWLRLVPIRGLDVSSTDIRARLREGRSTRYLVPEEVREQIVASGHYAAPAGGPL